MIIDNTPSPRVSIVAQTTIGATGVTTVYRAMASPDLAAEATERWSSRDIDDVLAWVKTYLTGSTD